MNYKIYFTAIKKIDEPLGGGFYGGSIASIFGDPNIGKSIFCLQMAYKLSFATFRHIIPACPGSLFVSL